MDEHISTQRQGPASRGLPRGTCPRCGDKVATSGRGRPRTWCSQACRRAAYEERRAASQGAIAVEVVERVETVEHPLRTCVDRAIESPTGCRRVLDQLARLARDGELQNDPKWQQTYTAVFNLLDGLHTGPRYR